MSRPLLILLMSLLVPGCNLLEFPAYVLLGRRTQKVKAEYPHLAKQKIAIIVSAGPAIDFEHPFARTNLALACAQAIKSHVKGTQFAQQEEVEMFQQENINWITVPKSQIARRFDASHLIWLDLIQFTLREENSVNLLRGHIVAAVRVYDAEASDQYHAQYETQVIAALPKAGPIAFSESARQQIYRQTLLQFAEQLARKFYNHKIPAK